MVWPGLFLAWLDCSNSRNSASENQDTKKYCIFQGEIPSLYAGRDKRGKTMSVTTLIKTCVLPLLAVLTTCSASVFAHPDPFHRIEQLSVRIRETPDSASLYLKRASLYLAVGRSAEAVSDLRTVRVLAPEDDRALLTIRARPSRIWRPSFRDDRFGCVPVVFYIESRRFLIRDSPRPATTYEQKTGGADGVKGA